MTYSRKPIWPTHRVKARRQRNAQLLKRPVHDRLTVHDRAQQAAAELLLLTPAKVCQ